MTAVLSLDVRHGREELRRQMLALVLTFVLVWYTFVVPAGAVTPRRFESDDDDGEVRGVKTDSDSGEDLDWPEYIYP